MKKWMFPLLCAAIFLGGCVATSKPVPVANAVPSATQSTSGFHYGEAISLPGPEPVKPFDNYLWQYFNRNHGKSVCLESADKLATIKRNVSKMLLMGTKSREVKTRALAFAAATIYPCPFSPYLVPVRPAKPEDLIGEWLTPDESQLLRLPPKFGQDKMGPVPVSCEAFGFFSDGRSRSVVLASREPCTTQQVAHAIAAWQQTPAVSTWRPTTKGRFRIEHADAKDHPLDWEVHVVTRQFIRHGVFFRRGDLIAYLRKTGPNDRSNVSRLFRHLRRFDPVTKFKYHQASRQK